MSRWNIEKIFFLSISGQRRDVTLDPDVVNIITGASGTGKSTLIKAIDYCLGSKTCELPAHVRRRTVAVGVKWVSGEMEMVIGRIVPPVGQGTSGRMFTIAGRNLPLPTDLATFDGATTVHAAKAFLERAFGIGDVLAQADEVFGRATGRATVRHVTPYLFVTKEVIYSESVLLHGLEQADEAPDIMAAMPYFLRATDEVTGIHEQRLRQLRRALERAESRARGQREAENALKQRAVGLIAEASRIGIATPPPDDASEEALLELLRAMTVTVAPASAYPSDGELSELNIRRREILEELAKAGRQLQATRTAARDAVRFEQTVVRQRDKLMLAEHLQLQDIANVCPLCESPSDRGKQTARALQATLRKVRGETAAVERVRPQLVEHDRALVELISRLNLELRQVDAAIQTWIRQNNDAQQLADLAQIQAHLLGRISFFLETANSARREAAPDLDVLRAEIAELEALVDRAAKEVKLRRAEAKISEFASEAIRDLPTIEPCIGAELYFSSRQPDVAVVEAGSGAVLPMPAVGSDQNYLAIHIALSFALQRYFESVDAPVPGVLVFDQVSRPYFPARGEDADETEIVGREEDEDVQAMRKHIDFIFAETARRSGCRCY